MRGRLWVCWLERCYAKLSDQITFRKPDTPTCYDYN